MSEEKSGLSRRDFLKLATLTAVTLATPETEKLRNITKENIDTKIPGTMSPEKLKELNITIHNTLDVQLYLRDTVTEFALFKDLESKKLGGVTITLVDAEYFSFLLPHNTPELPAEILRAFYVSPREWTNDDWEQKIKRAENEMSGRASQKDEAGAMYERVKKLYEMAKGDEDEKTALHMLNKYRSELVFLNKEEAKTLKIYEILSGDREKAIEYLENEEINNPNYTGLHFNGPTIYSFAKDNPGSKVHALFEKHPELKNQVFIYLAVKGVNKPNPSDSFTNPEKLQVNQEVMSALAEEPKLDEYLFGTRFAGLNFRHEVNHYTNLPPYEVGGETKTDLDTFNSLVDSWENRYKKPLKSYPFIFLTKEGPVFAKKAPNKNVI